jgi:hypothetical protein
VLVKWLESPLYVTETVRVPAGADGIIVTEHVADDPEPDMVHVPPGVNVTVPVGVIAVPAAELSATVAVHVVAWLITTVDGVQLTVVVVDRLFTVTVVLPELDWCVASPLYVAETVSEPDVEGVIVTEQVADDDDAVTSVHTPPGVKVTVPVGVVGVANVSVTVAVHVVAWLITTVEGTQLTVVVVGCRLPTTTVAWPWLVACTPSPL